MPLRIAIISTPRSGSTWFRHLLSKLYKIPSGAFDNLEPEEWERFPDEFILQLHCPRDPGILSLLHKHRFQVISLARNPFDILISILHFAWFCEGTDQWLLGAGGDEKSIRGAMPRSVPFVEYAKGPRAAELFAVTADWWDAPEVVRIRYEDLVAGTETELRRLAAMLGTPRAELREVIEQCSLDRLRASLSIHHFWKGQPGLWRRLLTSADIAGIMPALEGHCRKLGYECVPDAALTPAVADAAWVDLTGSELVSSMRKHGKALLESQESRQRIEDLERDLRLMREQRWTRYQAMESYSGFPLEMAAKIHSIRIRYPGLYGAVTRLLGRSRKWRG